MTVVTVLMEVEGEEAMAAIVDGFGVGKIGTGWVGFGIGDA